MASPTVSSGNEWTAADLMAHFGPILLRRIRHEPSPGTASERNVVEIHDREDRLYELVDGVLVEKAVGIQESYLALFLGSLIRDFAMKHDLGITLGADGMTRLAPGLVRIPDVSFISWDKFPRKKIPADPMLSVAPDLAVEVLSPSNTEKEMQRKLQDYFAAGVRLVWFVDLVKRAVQVFESTDRCSVLDGRQTLKGEPVLPGFALPLKQLFAQLDSGDASSDSEE